MAGKHVVQDGVRRSSIPSGPGRLAQLRDRQASAPSPVAVRGTTRVVYTDISALAHQGRRAEPAGHGLGVIEHALMMIFLAGMVFLLISAIGHSTNDLWQQVSNTFSR
jgi:hypothetical protein